MSAEMRWPAPGISEDVALGVASALRWAASSNNGAISWPRSTKTRQEIAAILFHICCKMLQGVAIAGVAAFTVAPQVGSYNPEGVTGILSELVPGVGLASQAVQEHQVPRATFSPVQVVDGDAVTFKA